MSPISGLKSDETLTAFPDLDHPVFFDDFLGASYDNTVWSLNGVTITWQNAIGGRILIRTPIGVGSAEFYMGNNAAYSAATRVTVEWKGSMIPAATGGNTECGAEGSGDQSGNWIAWYYNPGTSANFQCQCGSTGGNTFVNSGIAGDNNEHRFRIVISTGIAEFWLDGRFILAITSNVTTSRLQPYVWGTGSSTTPSDFNADYVLITGDR